MKRNLLILLVTMSLATGGAYAQDADSGLDISDPLAWVEAYVLAMNENGADQFVTLGVSLGMPEMQMRAQSAQIAVAISPDGLLENHVVSYSACGDGFRQIFVYTLWEPMQPLFLKFDFLRSGDAWIVGHFNINTQLAALPPFDSPSCEEMRF